MRNKAIAISGLLAAAFTATIAFGQWTVPLALAPAVVDQNKGISVDFVNAPASKVLDWLKTSGANFVVDATSMPSNKRLTVHIKNQPMDKAIEAIADALGMDWTKKGQIYTLKGGGTWNSASSNWTPKEAEKWAKEFGDNFKVYSPNFEKNWEWNAKDAKKWEEFGKSFEYKFKNMPEGHFEFKGTRPDGKFGELDQKEFEKLMHEHLKDLPKMNLQLKELEKLKALKGFEFKGMDKDGKFGEMDRKALEKMLHEHLKELPKMNLQLKELEDLKDLKGFEYKNLPKFDSEALKGLKEFEKLNLSKMKAGMADLKNLVHSLTPEQLEKNKSRGYLTLEDLTPDQRKLLGDWGTGDESKGDKERHGIHFEIDGVKVTIKNK